MEKYQPMTAEQTAAAIEAGNLMEAPREEIEETAKWTRETGITIANDVKSPEGYGTTTWSDGTECHWDNNEFNAMWIEADGSKTWIDHMGYDTEEHGPYNTQAKLNYEVEEARGIMTAEDRAKWEEARRQ